MFCILLYIKPRVHNKKDLFPRISYYIFFTVYTKPNMGIINHKYCQQSVTLPSVHPGVHHRAEGQLTTEYKTNSDLLTSNGIRVIDGTHPYVRRTPRNYKPMIWNNKTTLDKFLSKGVLINKSNLTLTGLQIETLSCGLKFVPDFGQNKQLDILEAENARKRLTHQINWSIIRAEAINKHQTDVPLAPKKLPDSCRRACNNYLHARAKRLKAVGPVRVNIKPVRLRSGISKHYKQHYDGPCEQTWQMSPEIRKQWKILRDGCYTTPTNTATAPSPIRRAIQELKNNKEAYITSADKGGGLVVWSQAEYKTEASRQLNDPITYAPIPPNVLPNVLKEVHRGVHLAARRLKKGRFISANDYNGLTKELANSIPSALYLLPKIHKEPNRTSGTYAGRPIVATHSSPTYGIDKYITELTAPLLPLIAGSLRDTTDLLNKLPKGKLPGNTRILTADVNSLYPSIPWAEGEDAAVEFYTEHLEELTRARVARNLTPPPPPQEFRTLLKLVLENSILHFQGADYYHQTKGTAMGCCISVYFANTYMLKITKSIVEDPPAYILVFLRFIDDILVITTGTDEQIQTMFNSITNTHISYAIETASWKGNFLDLIIYLDETGKIQTRPYDKPTTVAYFLQAGSMHPTHLVQSIPYAQLLRIKRNCSLEGHYQRRSLQMMRDFHLRGYSLHSLLKAKNKCDRTTRAYTLVPASLRLNQKKQTNFSTAFKYIRAFTSYTNDIIVKGALRILYDNIKQHYNRTPAGRAFINQKLINIYSIRKHLGAHFTKVIKNPHKINHYTHAQAHA